MLLWVGLKLLKFSAIPWHQIYIIVVIENVYAHVDIFSLQLEPNNNNTDCGKSNSNISSQMIKVCSKHREVREVYLTYSKMIEIQEINPLTLFWLLYLIIKAKFKKVIQCLCSWLWGIFAFSILLAYIVTRCEFGKDIVSWRPCRS